MWDADQEQICGYRALLGGPLLELLKAVANLRAKLPSGLIKLAC
jgi:hypothetical protein